MAGDQEDIQFGPRGLDDFEGIIRHLEQFESVDGPTRVDEMIDAISILRNNPLIGRSKDRLRELVIGKDSKGYLALYDYNPSLNLVLILAVRGQSELGYLRSF